MTGTGRCKAAGGGRGIHTRPCGHRRPRVQRAPGPGRVSRVRNMETPLGSPPSSGGAAGRSQEGRDPRAGQDAQEANAGGRKAAGNQRRHARLSRRGRSITGRIPGLVPGRESALT